MAIFANPFMILGALMLPIIILLLLKEWLDEAPNDDPQEKYKG